MTMPTIAASLDATATQASHPSEATGKATAVKPELRALFNDPSTVKLLATTGEDHSPHIGLEPSLHIDDTGTLIHFELSEHSETHRNLVRAIWFDGKVAVHATTIGGRRFHLTGRPVKALVAGPVFEAYYEDIRARRGDVDLATAWLIELSGVEEQGQPLRKESEERHFPLIHLDRIAKPRGV